MLLSEPFSTILTLAYIAILFYVSYTDLRWRTIPNVVIYPAILIALILTLTHPQYGSALLGAFLGGLVFLVPIFFYGPNLAGMGDVKLALFMGLVLGFPSILFALIIAFTAAFLVSLALMIFKNYERHSTIPFAPFLALGGILMLARALIA